MLKLITFPAAFGEPSASPFCVKAMCLLQVSGVNWTPKYTSDPRKTPNGKLPILIDAGVTIADSDAICDHLEKTFKIDFNKGLTAEQRAVSRAIIRMVEEHLYFVLVSDRWLNDDNWAVLKKEFFSGIPKVINSLVTNMIRNKTRAQMMAQGTARHSVKEQVARAAKDIAAIKTLLGDKPFLFGDSPTAADMSVVPILRGIAKTPTQTGLRDLITKDQVLMAYLDRGRDAMYPA
jgi:glutathione S-transferase